MTDTCKTCRYLDVPPRKDGKRVAYTGKAYRCLTPIPDLSSILPLSTMRAYGFRQPRAGEFAFPEWEGCPTHQPHSKKDETP